MGKIVATCKHELQSLEDGYCITVKDTNRLGQHVLSFMVVCPDCLVWYRENNLICYNEEQEKDWLSGKK